VVFLLDSQNLLWAGTMDEVEMVQPVETSAVSQVQLSVDSSGLPSEFSTGLEEVMD